MTQKELSRLHAYSSWATNRMLNAIEQLTTEQYTRDMKSSHGSIQGTLLHLVGAEKIWLSRWKGVTEPFLTLAEVPDLPAMRNVWEDVGRHTVQWLGTMTDAQLNGTFSLKTSTGETVTHIFWQAFQHLVNHSTYHRGQLVTMLRQLEVKPPVTDLIFFYRETAKLK
jgi:uncharacterized damage-inducible protein DinB